MTDQVVLSKLDSLNRCLQRVKEKTPSSADILIYDLDAQDIISLNLQRAIQICVDIASHIVSELGLKTPMTMAQGFELLAQGRVISSHLCERMQKSVGFRNLAVHDYASINWNIVFAVCSNHLDDFREFGKAVVLWMQKGDDKE